jgi:ribosome-associated protein
MFDPITLHSELTFDTARSGGAGGQNVNKVETKVELRLDVQHSKVLTDNQKIILLEKLTNKITNEGVLVLYHQTERTQLGNREKIIKKFNKLIEGCFVEKKKRKAMKPTAAMIEKRLNTKQHNSEIKAMRKRVEP